MYLDLIKDEYSEKSIEERGRFIERDKKHLADIIQTRITDDIENIVNRWYELDDIGVIREDGTFLKLLKESEELYSFGYYIGSISLIGVASEELCKFLINKYSIGDFEVTQNERIKLIFINGKISKEIKNNLHQIRKTRNKYIHFNETNLHENTEKMKADAYKVLTLFKSILQEVLSVSEIIYEDIVEKLVSKQKISFTEFKYKHRNLNKKMNGLDLQLDPDIPLKAVTELYKIVDIDIDSEGFKEITLFGLELCLPVIIDLTLPQAKKIKELKLEENNVIVATIVSSISTIGQTEEWQLLKIHDVYRGKLEL